MVRMFRLILIISLAFLVFNLRAQNTFRTAIPPGEINMHSIKNAVEMEDGSIFVLSSVNATGKVDLRLTKLDAFGEIQLDTVYDFTPKDEFNSRIIRAHDGGVLIGSLSYSYPVEDQDGIQDILIWKISTTGDIEWQKVIAARSFQSMIPTADGNYLILGSHYSESLDLLLIKMDPKGEVIWQRIIGDTWRDGAKWWEFPSGICKVEGGIYLVARGTDPGSPGYSGSVYKIDELGNVVQEIEVKKEYEDDRIRLSIPLEFRNQIYCYEYFDDRFYELNITTGSYTDLSDSVSLLLDAFVSHSCGFEDELVGVLEVEGGVVFQKYDSLTGASLERELPLSSHYFTDIIGSQDGGFIILGSSGEDTIEVAKVDCLGNIDFWSGECDSKIEEEDLILLYPNPATSFVQIESRFYMDRISIYNQLGQLVFTEALEESCKAHQMDIVDIPSGIYTLLIEGEVVTAKPFYINGF